MVNRNNNYILNHNYYIKENQGKIIFKEILNYNTQEIISNEYDQELINVNTFIENIKLDILILY